MGSGIHFVWFRFSPVMLLLFVFICCVLPPFIVSKHGIQNERIHLCFPLNDCFHIFSYCYYFPPIQYSLTYYRNLIEWLNWFKGFCPFWLGAEGQNFLTQFDHYNFVVVMMKGICALRKSTYWLRIIVVDLKIIIALFVEIFTRNIVYFCE